MNIEDIRQEMALLTDVTPLTGDRYAACLHTYEAASNQRALIVGWFTEHVIPTLARDSSSLLSIGCGAGDLDVKILASARKQSANVAYVGLEPDPEQCKKFVTRMTIADDGDVSVEGHNTSFEHFCGQQRFDLVSLVHSLYYMEDPEGAIDSALELVNESGSLVILIASNDSLNELSSSFWAFENAGSTWFSEDLDRHLDKRGLSFERSRIEARLDISACCDPHSERGIRIADFVAQVPTGALPIRLRHMIFNYLEASSQRDGDQRWLPHNVDAFTIRPDPAARVM